MPKAVARGRFPWHELMTTDPDAAIRFYSQVVGWGIEAFPDLPEYRMWTHGGKPRGGVIRQAEEDRHRGLAPHWLMYVSVPDTDATIRQAETLGARVRTPARSVPGVGRYAILADPQGILFAVYTPENPGGADEAEIGDFSWHELAAPDPSSAWSFYHALFGWEKSTAMDMGETGTYQIFRRGGGKTDVGAFYRRHSDMPGTAAWLMYARVPSADRAAETTTRLGGMVLHGPIDVPGGGRIAMCVDPQGAAFAVHSVAVPARAKPKIARKKSVKRKPARRSTVRKKPAKQTAKRRRR